MIVQHYESFRYNVIVGAACCGPLRWSWEALSHKIRKGIDHVDKYFEDDLNRMIQDGGSGSSALDTKIRV